MGHPVVLSFPLAVARRGRVPAAADVSGARARVSRAHVSGSRVHVLTARAKAG